jgi:hypothetical protein
MIGILYICTGKYHIFWKDFYTSAEQNFLPKEEKTYFVFTDAKEIYAENYYNVRKIYQKNLGWPGNTLMRFHIFLQVEQLLKKCDYLFFVNANTVITGIINSNILPSEYNDGLVVTLHPMYYNLPIDQTTLDRNPRSTAYISYGTGKHYFMGAFYGGNTEAFLRMTHTLKDCIDEDLDKNIVALWHDESHLNRYMLDKNPVILDPGYCYPQDLPVPFERKIYILDKNKFGGHHFMRN